MRVAAHSEGTVRGLSRWTWKTAVSGRVVKAGATEERIYWAGRRSRLFSFSCVYSAYCVCKASETIWTFRRQCGGTWHFTIFTCLDVIATTVKRIFVGTRSKCKATQASRTVPAVSRRTRILTDRRCLIEVSSTVICLSIGARSIAKASLSFRALRIKSSGTWIGACTGGIQERSSTIERVPWDILGHGGSCW